MATFGETLEQLEAQLEEWGKRLTALVERSEEISPPNKVDYGRRVAALQTKYRVARRTLEALREDDDDTKDRSTDSNWNELESAFFKIN